MTKLVFPASGIVRDAPDGTIVTEYDGGFLPASSADGALTRFLTIAKSGLHIPLNFQKNDKFELLPFMFDLDSTIAMFTRRFVKQISYGAVNWGILPFISDVKALLSSVKDLADPTRLDEMSRERFDLSYSFREDSGTYYSGTSLPIERMVGKVFISGSKFWDVPSSDEFAGFFIQTMLDELGVHPDLKTLWDVVPLSFVVDYFMPVGSYLDTIHPRGWYNPKFRVNGNWSLKGELEIPVTGYSSSLTPKARTVWNCYARETGLPSVLGSRPQIKEPQWQAPSAVQLFNTAYLARAASGLAKGPRILR